MATIYRRLLVAVDLSNGSAYIAQRGRSLAAALGGELELLHVVEPVPLVAPMAGDSVVPLSLDPIAAAPLPAEDELLANARDRMAELAAELSLSDAQWSVRIGTTKHEIVRVATERLIDLIVLGRRERHGLSMLLDFTEDAVLHRAPCDVLAIRVPS